MDCRLSMAAASAVLSALALRAQPVSIRTTPEEGLPAALNRVRALSATDKARGVEIVLAPGRYRLKKPLVFDEAAGGSLGAPVVVRAEDDGSAFLTSAIDFPASSFAPVRDRDVSARLPKEAADKVLVADLSGHDVTYWGERKRQFKCTPVPELFVDGMRMKTARWPNEGWATIKKVLDKGSLPVYAPGSNTPEKGEDRGGTFVYDGERPARWMKAPELWLRGFWCYDWSDAIIPVASINVASNTVTLAAPHQYMVQEGRNPSPRRWRAEHLLEELDAPGEYFIDRFAKRIYLYPEVGFSAESRVTVASADFPLIKGRKVHDLVFRGLVFEESYGSAATFVESARIGIERCVVKNIHERGMAFENCNDVRVFSCDFTEIGGGAMVFFSSRRKSLEPEGIVVEDCLFRRCAEHQFCYTGALDIGGVAPVVRHCEFTDFLHLAVRPRCNDMVFEYNVISNVCYGADDMSAFYKGGDPTMRGNVLRWNYWKDIGSTRGHGTAAVYFDCADCGERVYGNVFEKCGDIGKDAFAAVFFNGGHTNVAENNVFVDCPRAVSDNPWPQEMMWLPWLKSEKCVRLAKKEIDIADPKWVARYPELKDYFKPEPESVRVSTALRNAFVDTKEFSWGWMETNCCNVRLSREDVISPNGAYRLGPDDPVCRKIPGFKPIPFEKIGLLRKRPNGGQTIDPEPKKVTERIDLLQGGDLHRHWYTWSRKWRRRDYDPAGVFRAEGSTLKVSGAEMGCATTKDAYRDYRLTLEFRYVDDERQLNKTAARDGGLLIHSTGEDGAYGGIWMCSFEYNIIQGASGDLIVVGNRFLYPGVYSCKGRVDPATRGMKSQHWDPHGPEVEIVNNGRIRRPDIDLDWKNVREQELSPNENPIGEWNRVEVVCRGDRAEFFFNGLKVGDYRDLKPSGGRIQLQSEGFGIEYRNIALEPLL